MLVRTYPKLKEERRKEGGKEGRKGSENEIYEKAI